MYILPKVFINKVGMSLPDIPVTWVLIFIVYAPGSKERTVSVRPLDGQSPFFWTIIRVLITLVSSTITCLLQPPTQLSKHLAYSHFTQGTENPCKCEMVRHLNREVMHSSMFDARVTNTIVHPEGSDRLLRAHMS